MGSNISRLLGLSSGTSTTHNDGPLDASCAYSALLTSLSPAASPAMQPPPFFASVSTRSPSAQAFAGFARFPTEIRLMVWELVLPGERVVRIERFANTSHHHNPCESCRCIGSRARVPTLMHVNHETRHLALKSYTVTFKNRLFKPTYFNPDLDILFFASVDAFAIFAEPVELPHTLFPFASSSYNEDYTSPGSLRLNFRTVPRRWIDKERFEEKIRYMAFGRSNRLPCHTLTGETPWEEISNKEMLQMLGAYGNLTTLFIESVYLEDSGLHPTPPPLPDQVLERQLGKLWKLTRYRDLDSPKIVVIGPTSMKQMRFRAREARLWSWAKLAEHRP
ncbi:hypothetical protein BKA64DRAFT_709158 [Cadophora sp. MPI-SDFR-AT-0126]|nr:hypothetical protein BKA64DRAFT_709158 [Leotiomycetes sp. MPI-SDFR-AT-0126]